MDNNYDWETATEQFLQSDMTIKEFHLARGAEFSSNGYIPSYPAMVTNIRRVQKRARQLAAGNNFRVVALDSDTDQMQPAAEHSPLEHKSDDTCRRFTVRLPNGAELEFTTAQPERLAMQMMREAMA